MSEEKKDSQRGFEVKDKRLLGPDGRPLELESDDPADAPTAEPDAGQQSSGVAVNFATFVLSLSTSAMVHMGLVENPETKKCETNLPVAQQEIQIIEMLKEKTAGNLDQEESALVEDALFHLRMKYLEKTKV